MQGNILEEAGLLGKTEYCYNAFNQQTAVFMKDGGSQENRYDAEYLRAEVFENGGSSRFLYYNGELLAESQPDETVASRYILGYGVAAGWQKEKEGYHFYHLDEQNSTAYITDSGQRIENSYQYDAFGVIRGQNENIYNRILYTGQQYDPEVGQYYLRARYYNPVVGRFTQEDPYRGDGLNLYAYCANNPVTYYDPSGYACSFNAQAEENAVRENATLQADEAGGTQGNVEGGSGAGIPSGYYQDTTGSWNRPNGEFASNAEVGITSPANVSSGSHGNSLSDTRTNYGYALVDRDTNEILKFGETLYPDTRYSQKYLDANNAKMMIIEEGSKLDIHLWQHDMNEYYFYKYHEYPPKNSGGW